MSIEALAMAGADYIKCGFDLQELEREDLEKTPPQHLLAEPSRTRNKSEDQNQETDEVVLGKWQLMTKEEMETEARAKAMAAFNLFLLQISGLERIRNLHPPRKC